MHAGMPLFSSLYVKRSYDEVKNDVFLPSQGFGSRLTRMAINACFGDLRAIQECYDTHPDELELGDEFGHTPLHCVVVCSNVENGAAAAQLLLRLGAKINRPTMRMGGEFPTRPHLGFDVGTTPLTNALEHSWNLPLIRVLALSGGKVYQLLTCKQLNKLQLALMSVFERVKCLYRIFHKDICAAMIPWYLAAERQSATIDPMLLRPTVDLLLEDHQFEEADRLITAHRWKFSCAMKSSYYEQMSKCKRSTPDVAKAYAEMIQDQILRRSVRAEFAYALPEEQPIRLAESILPYMEAVKAIFRQFPTAVSRVVHRYYHALRCQEARFQINLSEQQASMLVQRGWHEMAHKFILKHVKNMDEPLRVFLYSEMIAKIIAQDKKRPLPKDLDAARMYVQHIPCYLNRQAEMQAQLIQHQQTNGSQKGDCTIQ